MSDHNLTQTQTTQPGHRLRFLVPGGLLSLQVPATIELDPPERVACTGFIAEYEALPIIDGKVPAASFRETLPSYRFLHGLERALEVVSIIARGQPADALMVSYGLPDHWLGLSVLLEKEVLDARRS